MVRIKKKNVTISIATLKTSSNIAVDSTSIKGWKMFPASDIPELFNYGHVYHYLVESVAAFGFKISAESSDDEDLDTESGYTATAKPLKKGRSLVNSGFVRDMKDYKNEECYFLRAHVHHSMKIIIQKNSRILGFIIGIQDQRTIEIM